jgi:hypothetical protein
MLDGITSSIESGKWNKRLRIYHHSLPLEYKKLAEQLGHVTDTEPFPWASGLRRSWYWDLCVCVTLDLPLVNFFMIAYSLCFSPYFQAVYALMLPTRFSPSSITSIALLQQATGTLALSLGECGDNTSSLGSLCSQAKWLYEAINHQSSMPQGTEPFPRPNEKSSNEGMKISFRYFRLDCYHM